MLPAGKCERQEPLTGIAPIPVQTTAAALPLFRVGGAGTTVVIAGVSALMAGGGHIPAAVVPIIAVW